MTNFFYLTMRGKTADISQSSISRSKIVAETTGAMFCKSARMSVMAFGIWRVPIRFLGLSFAP
jgi:hypothetical protein